jgi:predicted tellurium resistance membrane protein TerC
MNERKNKLFWSLFFLFCIGTTFLLDVFDNIDISKMSNGEIIILMIWYGIAGFFMRLWIKRNPKEIEKLFKIPE